MSPSLAVLREQDRTIQDLIRMFPGSRTRWLWVQFLIVCETAPKTYRAFQGKLMSMEKRGRITSTVIQDKNNRSRIWWAL